MRGINPYQFAHAVWNMIAAASRAVSTTHWNGTAVATPDTAGYPKVTVKAGTGTGEIALSSGAVTVGTNNDKTGYTLTAGSYSVRASSVQRGTLNINGASTNTATITSVTTTRALLAFGGHDAASSTSTDNETRITLTNATTVTANRQGSTGSNNTAWEVSEFF